MNTFCHILCASTIKGLGPNETGIYFCHIGHVPVARPASLVASVELWYAGRPRARFLVLEIGTMKKVNNKNKVKFNL